MRFDIRTRLFLCTVFFRATIFFMCISTVPWLGARLAAAESLPVTIKGGDTSIAIQKGSARQGELVLTVTLQAGKKVTIFDVSNPPRIVIDLEGVKGRKNRNVTIQDSFITSVRLGTHPDKLRIVVDLKSVKMPQYSWSQSSKSAILIINPYDVEAIGEPLPPGGTPITGKTPAVSHTITVTDTRPTMRPAEVQVVAPTPAPLDVMMDDILPFENSPAVASPTMVTNLEDELAGIDAPAQEPKPNDPPLPEVEEHEDDILLEDLLAKQAEVPVVAQTIEPTVAPTVLPTTAPTVKASRTATVAPSPTATRSPTKTPKVAVTPTPRAVENSDAKTTTLEVTAATVNLENSVPHQAVEQEVISIEFGYLGQDGKQPVIKLKLANKSEFELQRSGADSYTLAIPNCRILRPALKLPQFPPHDFEGFNMFLLQEKGEAVVAEIKVVPDVRISASPNDQEIWIRVAGGTKTLTKSAIQAKGPSQKR